MKNGVADIVIGLAGAIGSANRRINAVALTNGFVMDCYSWRKPTASLPLI